MEINLVSLPPMKLTRENSGPSDSSSSNNSGSSGSSNSDYGAQIELESTTNHIQVNVTESNALQSEAENYSGLRK
ncbi:hypothetical protein L6164_008626 [Bauhinia variegata]|uniref:Uncharacterized protein n=1 Tax=Bauhinia variegata TaxID=167791 RepID=A0ACB9PG69_BAUVA|nr:hypothetical protein L6164_008626 [Bauhinia variegata]